MTHKTLNTRHALESCTLQFHSWNPFNLKGLTKTLDSDLASTLRSKKPCLSDRSTAPSAASASDAAIDLSRLTILDDDHRPHSSTLRCRGTLRWIARKRRRRASRSVSGRSSDRSATRRCCSVGAASAAHATCSDFPVAIGTDSSGELFVNGGPGEPNWASDVSEARNPRDAALSVEREVCGGGLPLVGAFEALPPASESGYGSEPGYRGDGEFGYGDEFDEEEDDGRVLLWDDRLGVLAPETVHMEIVGENNFSEQKIHHRCRRKKHDWRMVFR